MEQVVRLFNNANGTGLAVGFQFKEADRPLFSRYTSSSTDTTCDLGVRKETDRPRIDRSAAGHTVAAARRARQNSL